MMSGSWCRGAIALGAVLVATSPASTQGSKRLAATAALQPGLWELRELGKPGAAPRSICLPDPAALMQIQHRGAPCTRLVIANDPKSATVHYTCPSTDFGRTTIRVETPRVAIVDTQGIDGNAPFAYRLEARRKGACTAAEGR